VIIPVYTFILTVDKQLNMADPAAV